jgi:seryl-tRNA synthetase
MYDEGQVQAVRASQGSEAVWAHNDREAINKRLAELRAEQAATRKAINDADANKAKLEAEVESVKAKIQKRLVLEEAIDSELDKDFAARTRLVKTYRLPGGARKEQPMGRTHESGHSMPA